MKTKNKLYFEKLKPAMPSLREINQSNDKELCCSDCVEFWDKIQSQKPYFDQMEKEQKFKELEFNKLQKKLYNEHKNDPVTVICAENKKCMCGHTNETHSKTIVFEHRWRNKKSHSGCLKCNCPDYIHCENPTKQQRNRRRYYVDFMENKPGFIKEYIRKSMLIIFNDTDYTYCFDSKNNSHKFTNYIYQENYCIYCRYYKSDIYSIKTDWELK
mgnify:CR=1 FL=1